MCVSTMSGSGEEILGVKDENDLLRGVIINDVLSSPGIPVCVCVSWKRRHTFAHACTHKRQECACTVARTRLPAGTQ